jgi:hypothetical protein
VPCAEDVLGTRMFGGQLERSCGSLIDLASELHTLATASCPGLLAKHQREDKIGVRIDAVEIESRLGVCSGDPKYGVAAIPICFVHQLFGNIHLCASRLPPSLGALWVRLKGRGVAFERGLRPQRLPEHIAFGDECIDRLSLCSRRGDRE